MDKISCVITTYKRPVVTLRRAVESIVNQTYSNLEIIIVNDAPQLIELSEQIRIMLSTYTNFPLTYIVHKENMGACHARNTAIRHATGNYVAFLDDDDEWLTTKLEKQYKLICKEDVALVYCDHYEIQTNGDRKLVKEPLAREGLHTNDFERLLLENFIGSTSYPLLRLEVVRSVGGFDTGLKSSQDHDLWIRIAEKHTIAYCNEPLVNYYITQDSISSNIENKVQGFEYLLNKYEQHYKENTSIYNYRLNYIAYCLLKSRHFKSYLKFTVQAFKVKLFCKYNFMILNKLVKKIKSLIY
ncbi:glycosyltransferase [Paenibacillus sp. PL2-23]|uniref:glycosyltransferase family 2 protein n=1 Tax=Paenibacillus sp. PL2-23 TaxID=2100729 RepID=UPI0030FA68F7